MGCDSTAILNLNIGYTDGTSQLAVSCDSIYWNGYYLDSSGIYSYHLILVTQSKKLVIFMALLIMIMVEKQLKLAGMEIF